VSRTLILALFVALARGAALSQPPKAAPPAAQPGEPPEEDAGLIPKEYAFNPLQATKEIKIGNFYFKKGNFRAAALRFEEATKWNPGDAEAWSRLGDAREKLKDKKGAREARQKSVELAADPKLTEETKKKLAGKP
jgi:tetratricopeptide (TPR) repeat protein